MEVVGLMDSVVNDLYKHDCFWKKQGRFFQEKPCQELPKIRSSCTRESWVLVCCAAEYFGRFLILYTYRRDTSLGRMVEQKQIVVVV